MTSDNIDLMSVFTTEKLFKQWLNLDGAPKLVALPNPNLQVFRQVTRNREKKMLAKLIFPKKKKLGVFKILNLHAI